MLKKIKSNFYLLVILIVLCGLVSGVCGELLARAYISNDLSSPYLNQEVNLSDLNNNRSNLIISDPKKVVVNQDVKITETINSLAPSMVSVFKEIPKTASDPLKPEYYALNNPLFLGLVMTSDGWVMATLPSDLKGSFAIKGYVAIGADRKIYSIDKITVLNNLPGDVIFFHLSNASNLAVRKISVRSELALGQSLLVIDNHNNAWPTTLSSFKKTPDVLSSDSMNARLALANNSDAIQKNSFVFDLSGDLTAIIGANKEIIPAFAYTTYWQSFDKKVLVARPSLGVNYLDLSASRLPGLNLDKGALLYPGSDKVAIVKNSAAANAGFVAGDIISWIDNQEINSANDLADIIATYNPGDKITITYIRDGQEKAVDVKLGELK